jgi:hypothetical protein
MNTTEKGKNNLQEDVASTAHGRKEGWHTVRLFGTNSLKEGVMYRICSVSL